MGYGRVCSWGLGLAAIAACGYPSLEPIAGRDGPEDARGHEGDGSLIDDAMSSADAGAASSRATSCASLAAMCGATGHDDCCNSPIVVGGDFYRSFDLAADTDSGDMAFRATVSTFRLDKYEVTVARFRAFVNAGMGTQQHAPKAGEGAHGQIPNSGWDPSWNTSLASNTTALLAEIQCSGSLFTWTDAPGANEARPINCVTWYEAMAFCAWDGGHLATESEWNYAAAAGNQQRPYPWSIPVSSTTLDVSYASYGDSASPPHCLGDGAPDCTIADIIPVGSRPRGDGRWGQSDLGGNVQEWVLDFYGSYDASCKNCANLKPASPRVQRGGTVYQSGHFLRTGVRSFIPPTSRAFFNGIRCARDV